MKVLPTIIFYLVGQTSPEACSGDIKKNEMIKSIMKRQVFSSSWLLEWFFCFLFEKMPSSILILLMLFAHVGKRSNSRSQMFSKTILLKYFAIFTGKHLYWSLFLIQFQDWRPVFLFKKRLQHRCFSVNIAQSLRMAFLWRPVHYTFSKFYLLIDNLYFRVTF